MKKDNPVCIRIAYEKGVSEGIAQEKGRIYSYLKYMSTRYETMDTRSALEALIMVDQLKIK